MKTIVNCMAAAAFLAALAAGSAQAAEVKAKPIAEMTLHSAGKPVKPIYADDMKKQADDMAAKADKLAEQIAGFKINPEKDEVEKMFEGSISIARHLADTHELRDMFTRCEAQMRNQVRDKEDSGKASDADKAQFKQCAEHCDKLEAKLDGLHKNASMLGSAARQRYVLEGWEKHTKLMAEAHAMIKECPAMFAATLKHCEQLVDGFTCTMHPEVMSSKGGDCPKCGMKMVRLEPESKK